jgi:hypothetical protein
MKPPVRQKPQIKLGIYYVMKAYSPFIPGPVCPFFIYGRK